MVYNAKYYLIFRRATMLTQSLHNQNSILGAALAGTSARVDVIMNNMANSDVPGFRAREVDFETALKSAIENFRRTGSLDLSRVRPTMRNQAPGMAFRMDGSNVDMEREMIQLYIHTTRYEVITDSIINNSRRLNAVIQGR